MIALSASDYNDAMQSLDKRFKDIEIKQSKIAETDSFGLPTPYSGNFACVYKIKTKNKNYALRFFLSIDAQKNEKYKLLKQAFKTKNIPYFVDFDLQEDAVLVKSHWYPLLKMEWVEGKTLDEYIKNNLAKSDVIIDIANKFANLVFVLKSNNIAHGDLQHGNIIVKNNDLILIDYDALYCEETKHLQTNEIGMPNYQHPNRKAKDISKDIDDFSAWIIYISLIFLSKDKSLFNKNDTLIFEKSDLENPKKSKTFNHLLKINDSEIQYYTNFIINSLLQNDVSKVPKFNSDLFFDIVKKNSEWWNKNQSKTSERDWIESWIKKKP